MAKERNVAREIWLSLGAAVVFGGAFAAYLLSTIPSREELLAKPMLSPMLTDNKPSELDHASTVVQDFVGHLAAGRHEAAYALMAEPYRKAVPLDAFRGTVAGSAFLASAQSGLLRRTNRMVAPTSSYTLQGSGLIVAGAGSVDVNFVFLVTGGQFRILVLSLAGVPVLDGISVKSPVPLAPKSSPTPPKSKTNRIRQRSAQADTPR